MASLVLCRVLCMAPRSKCFKPAHEASSIPCRTGEQNAKLDEATHNNHLSNALTGLLVNCNWNAFIYRFSNHSGHKHLTILPNNHPFTPGKATGRLPGAVRVRCLAK